MSLFESIPEPEASLPFLPMDGGEAIQVRLSIVESQLEGGAKVCRSLFEAVNAGEYHYSSACKAYHEMPELLSRAISELNKLMEGQSVGRPIK